jgi:hypothetical protein
VVAPAVLPAVVVCPRGDAMTTGSGATFFISAAFFASAALVAVAPVAGAGFLRTFVLALQGLTVSALVTR